MMTEPDNSSPNVNFYILSDSDLQRRLLFVYRLVEKAYKQALPTLVLTSGEEQLSALDRLLWTAKPADFLAHEVITERSQSPLPPIVLADNAAAIKTVNFTPRVVIDLSYDATPLDFPKIMLVANQHPDVLPNARMKYQGYVRGGIKPNVYKI
ncbi:MAG: hypothetical protein CSA45_02315 [Gammaproteobacteria bacterium]|nr:MAG: hypothetical protein CSA45_02315 [Gammaproteobacteria bacterium]